MSDDGSPGSALRVLTTKLRHSLLDIRERALASLAFKLDNGLLGASDVGRHLPILRALLEWFNFENTGEKGKEVLKMLRRIATEDPSSVQRLLELGADRFLRDLSGDGGEHLASSIDSLIAFWEKAGADAGDAPPPAPPSPARQSKSASYAAAAQKAAAGASQDAQAERAAEKAAGKTAGEKAAPAPEPKASAASPSSAPAFSQNAMRESMDGVRCSPPSPERSRRNRSAPSSSRRCTELGSSVAIRLSISNTSLLFSPVFSKLNHSRSARRMGR